MSETSCVLADEDLEMVRRRYQERIASHGVSLASLKTGGEEKQRVRYAVHSAAIRTPRPTVLDIGCGLGHFGDYLAERFTALRYDGYDIVPEYVDACRRQQPGNRFEVRNIFDEGIAGEYDYVVMCQVLNNKYGFSDNVAVMQMAMALAFEHCRVCASIDMMSCYVDYREEHLFYYSPEEMFGFAKTLTRRVALRHDYRPHEFCLQLVREEAPGFVA